MTAHRRPLWPLLALVFLVLVAGCGEEAPTAEPGPDESGESEPDEPDDTDDPEDDPGDDPEEGAGDDEDSPLGIATEQALKDAAERTGVDMGDIEVIEAEEVTWSDGAIGCPDPGESYTQALVEGYRIVLEADGQQLHYHAADGEEPFHCADPQEPAEG